MSRLTDRPLVMIRGGGELGTGAGHALARAGLRVVVVDRPLPGALRLGVAFAAAAIDGRITVCGVEAVHARSRGEIANAWIGGRVPVWTGGGSLLDLKPTVLIDSRMRHLSEPLTTIDEAPVVIGIGPGFEAGRDADYVLESNRGPRLGEVIVEGKAEDHTGIPGDVLGYREQRILRAPRRGEMTRVLTRGDFVCEGDVVAHVCGEPVRARLDGMIRGLKLSGVPVGRGHKVGDVDPRRDRALLRVMTDKARAIGRGAVHAAAMAGIVVIAAESEPTRPGHDDAP